MLLQVCCLLRTSSIVVPDVSRIDYSFYIELAFLLRVVTLLTLYTLASDITSPLCRKTLPPGMGPIGLLCSSCAMWSGRR
jgi:hypothetical protein